MTASPGKTVTGECEESHRVGKRQTDMRALLLDERTYHGRGSHRFTSEVLRSRSVLYTTKLEAAVEDEGDEASAGSTSTQAILNLVIATAGGIGMVTLPGTFSTVGYLEGILLLVISSLCACVSLVLLNLACGVRKESSSSYGELVASSLGPAGSYVLEALTLAYCFGQVICYLGAIGGQLKSLSSLILTSMNLSLSAHWSIGSAALLMFPLSLLPEKSAMRFAGAVGTFCMIFIVATVVLGDGISAVRRGGACSLAASDHNVPAKHAFSHSISAMLKSAPIFLFSMNASVIYVPVRKEHQAGSLSGGRSTAESYIVIGCSLFASAFFYLLCAVTAYYAYCSEIPENVVDVWPLSWIPGILARAALSLELLVAGAGIYIPLGRASLWHLIRGPEASSPASTTTRAFASFAIVLLGVFGSILLSGALTLPLAMTSALCVTAQMFVLPGLILYKTSVKCGGGRGCSTTALGFALVGIVFGILSLAALFGAF
jgi:amino acid permease